jgi:hypothetical protein
MKHIPLYLIVPLFFALQLTSCKQTITDTKPGSHGRISEMLVVMDPTLWKGDLGDTVRNFFGQFYPYLNQAEPWFTIIHRPPREFDQTYSLFRNILFFVMEPELDGGSIHRETDYWAIPQTVIQIKGPGFDELHGLFLKNSEAILQAFDQSEVRRLVRVMNSINRQVSSNSIKELLGLHIAVPDGFYIATEQENFVWARKVIRSRNQEQAFWITTIPYTDTTQFAPQRVMELRDSIARAQIPVFDETSYMGTEYRFGYQNRILEVNGSYALETRGLWRTFGNHSAGGPFLNFLIHDEKHARLIMIDTYVYRPNEDKRDLLRQLEGVVHTLKL